MKKIISLGLGVQSTALYYMSVLGELPPVDAAIFSDPGKEKKQTYEYLQFLLDWARKHNGPPIIIANDKNLYLDLLKQSNSTGQLFCSIPAYTGSNLKKKAEGMLRRQCTNEYKIAPVNKAIRKVYGITDKSWTPQTEVWKGITLDELERMSIPDKNWKVHVYPFLNYRATKRFGAERMRDGESIKMTRNNVLAWYAEKGLPIPPKSSCVFCPYQSDHAWAAMKREDPEDFAAAVEIDRAIRDSSKKGESSKIYLHRSLKPLEEATFDTSGPEIVFGECKDDCHL